MHHRQMSAFYWMGTMARRIDAVVNVKLFYRMDEATLSMEPDSDASVIFLSLPSIL